MPINPGREPMPNFKFSGRTKYNQSNYEQITRVLGYKSNFQLIKKLLSTADQFNIKDGIAVDFPSSFNIDGKSKATDRYGNLKDKTKACIKEEFCFVEKVLSHDFLGKFHEYAIDVYSYRSTHTTPYSLIESFDNLENRNIQSYEDMNKNHIICAGVGTACKDILISYIGDEDSINVKVTGLTFDDTGLSLISKL